MTSVILTLHNKASYVSQTIQSVIAQSIFNWQLIIVENNSTDDGPVLAQRFSERDSRILFFDASAEVRGPGAARNFGLKHATGEWVLFLDADDMIAPDYLAERLASAEKSSEAPIVAGCWCEFRDGVLEGAVLRRPAAFQQALDALRDVAIGFAPWILHSALIKRSWVEQNREWPEELDRMPSEDAAFWFRILLGAEKIAWCENSGALHRIGIAESREGSADMVKRASALRGVVNHNLRLLRANGLEPSPRQCETLMRVYEDSFQKLRREGQNAEARIMLAEARFWLGKSKTFTAGIILRKILGIGLFERLRAACASLKSGKGSLSS